VVTAFAVFLLLIFVEIRRKAISGAGCRSPPANLDFSKKFRLEETEVFDNTNPSFLKSESGEIGSSQISFCLLPSERDSGGLPIGKRHKFVGGIHQQPSISGRPYRPAMKSRQCLQWNGFFGIRPLGVGTAGQVAGAFHNNPIVEHFDLDVGSFDAVVAVCGGVYDNFLPNEFWEFGCCDKFSFFSEISMFFNLIPDEGKCLFPQIILLV